MLLIVLLIIAAVGGGVLIANAVLSPGTRRRHAPRTPASPPVAILAPSGPAPRSRSDAEDFALLADLAERWRREAPVPHVPYPPGRSASGEESSPVHTGRVHKGAGDDDDAGDENDDGGDDD
jgi:hypothetical protein